MRVLKRIAVWIRNIAIFLLLSSVLSVVFLRFVPIYFTPLMFIRMHEQKKAGKKIRLEHQWVPLSKIAQPLPQAVIDRKSTRLNSSH